MNMSTDNADADDQRPIDRWFTHYSHDHLNDTNQWIHVFAVPAILWSAVAMMWCIPVPGTLFQPGLWAALAMFFAWMFYNRASRKLGYGMLAIFVAMAWAMRWLYAFLGPQHLLFFGMGIFIVAWVGQFIGHRIEGRKPSFLTDLTYLLIGPAWVLAKLYRKLGWSY